MKAIMYHYVRPDSKELPYFRHLHIDDFSKQLEIFGNDYGFVSKEDFAGSLKSGEPSRGVILTFDDGLSDHYEYVFPKLKEYNLWGIFYISTSPFKNKKLINVHRIHMLVGKYGGRVIKEKLNNLITDDMLSHQHVKEYQENSYSRQDNDISTSFVKRCLNYYIDYNYRSDVINKLMSIFYPNESTLVSDFYLNENQILKMSQDGMVIGSHTVNHPVMSKLSSLEQEKEIYDSFSMLKSITGLKDFKTFCYPYGGFHSFTQKTEELLDKCKCDFSFNVESRDIKKNDILNRKQALPRYDCNEFPFGRVREIKNK